MSVINQMLKDLDQRSAESHNHTAQPDKGVSAYSARKTAVVTGISVLVLCLISFYVWQLINENNALKAEKLTNQTSVLLAKKASVPRVNEASIPVISPAENVKQNQKVTTLIKAKAIAPVELEQRLLSASSVNNAQIITPKSIVNNSSTRVTAAKRSNVIIDSHSHSGAVSSHSHDVASASSDSSEVSSKPKKNINTMSVSRRQLSADELAEQKLALAEKALGAKQIDKAEKLLEDAVIIRPSDSLTRQKLAALWFGRQAYQDATNLLSQGIALNGKDSALRKMKARIHLQQGQVTSALDTLKPLAQLEDEQYQIMLANTAQQAQQNKIAVNSYQVLINMQPGIGRWHMGLAVLYDKNSQFNLAKVSYKNALTKNDLSIYSENFVKQRIQVIGQ